MQQQQQQHPMAMGQPQAPQRVVAADLPRGAGEEVHSNLLLLLARQPRHPRHPFSLWGGIAVARPPPSYSTYVDADMQAHSSF